MAKKRICVNLDEQKYKDLKKKANREERTISYYINKAIEIILRKK